MSDSPQFRIERFDPRKHRGEEFSCESAALTEFLQKRARKEMEARASGCFVLVEENDPVRIVGFYTLSQTSVSLQQLPSEIAAKPPLTQSPAMVQKSDHEYREHVPTKERKRWEIAATERG